ncbi:hypothetical protein ES702_03111 [subsurface metagenome]
MRTFENLMKDLDKEEGTRVVFDLDKYKEVLKNPPKPLRILNFQVLMYLCLIVPIDEKTPPLRKIARDLKLNFKVVKGAIKDLRDFGVLGEVNKNKSKGDD